MLGYFVRHRLAANLLMIAMLGFGFFGLSKMQTQLMPDVNIPFFNLEGRWTGSSAELVVDNIIKPLSKDIKQLDSVKRVNAYAQDGSFSLSVGLNLNEDPDKQSTEIQKLINRFEWPDGVDTPQLQQVKFEEPVSYIVLAKEGDINGLRDIATEAKQQLIDLGLSSIQTWGFPGTALTWQADLNKWLTLGVLPNELANTLRSGHSQMAVGVNNGQSLIAGEKFSQADNFPYLVVNNTPMDQLGSIYDDSEGEAYLQVEGKAAVILIVNRPQGLGVVDAGKKVEAWRDDFQHQYGDFLHISLFANAADMVSGILDLLISNAMVGLLLVLLTLFVLLNSRVAFWTAAGIPVAILGTLGLLYFFGGSLNLFSIFALLIALGIVVDDAIVVSEETLTLHEKGQSPDDAAVNGVKSMFTPVVAAALTSIAAFSPLMFLPGPFGEMLRPVPLVIMCVLAASLFECFFVLPGHLNHALSKRKEKKPSKMRLKVDGVFSYVRDHQFRSLIKWLLRNRLTTLVFTVCLFAFSLALISSKMVKISGGLDVEENLVTMSIDFYDDVDEFAQRKYVAHVLDGLNQLEDDYPGMVKQHLDVVDVKAHNTTLYVDLVNRDGRDLDNTQMVAAWRENIEFNVIVKNNRANTDTQDTNSASNTDTKQVAFTLFSDSLTDLKSAAAALKDRLQLVPYLKDVNDNVPTKSFQINIQASLMAKTLGMDDQYLTSQASAWLNAQKVFELSRGGEVVELKVGLTELESKHLDLIDALPIRSPQGDYYTLGQLTDATREIAIAGIRLENGQMSVLVTAQISDDNLEVTDVSEQLSREIVQPIRDQFGVESSMTGSGDVMAEVMASLKVSSLIAVCLIFLVLAWVFQSWTWPFAIVVAIPLALTGAIFGHFFLKFDLTFMSFLGMFGVAGIVVNDSIILVDRFRQLYEQGMEKNTAIIEAACQRFRAVLLTTITTVIGLVPILFEMSIEAQIVKTMAISMAFGLFYGTFIVLVVTPCLMTLVGSSWRHLSVISWVAKPKEQIS